MSLDREKKTEELIKQHDYTLIHPSNNWNIIRGAGTATFELIHEIQDLDYIFAPVGGGELLSGTSLAVKELSEKTKVIGVEPENADDAFRSIRDNRIYPWTFKTMIKDEFTGEFIAKIPKLTQGINKYYFIVCDIFGNKLKSEIYTYKVPTITSQTSWQTLNSFLGVLLLIFYLKKTKLKRAQKC
ncbi:MAG: pyridoxal-phosphate dependent enzyme [Candidatus Heimdallarchaeaceae archaeon]